MVDQDFSWADPVPIYHFLDDDPMPGRNAGRRVGLLDIELLEQTFSRKTRECTRSLVHAIVLGLLIYGGTYIGISIWRVVIPLRRFTFLGLFKDADELKWTTFIFCCHWIFFRMAMMVIFLSEHVIVHLARALTGWKVKHCAYDTVQKLAGRLGPNLYQYSRAVQPTFESDVLVSLVLFGAFWLGIMHFKAMEFLAEGAEWQNGDSFKIKADSDIALRDWDKLLRLLLVWFLMLLTSALAQTILELVDSLI